MREFPNFFTFRDTMIRNGCAWESLPFMDSPGALRHVVTIGQVNLFYLFNQYIVPSMDIILIYLILTQLHNPARNHIKQKINKQTLNYCKGNRASTGTHNLSIRYSLESRVHIGRVTMDSSASVVLSQLECLKNMLILNA